MEDDLNSEQNHIIKALKRFEGKETSDPSFSAALVEAVVYEVAKDSLIPFFERYPDVVMKFIGTCLDKLTEAYSILEKSLTRNLEKRICLALLRLAENLGERRRTNKSLNVPISKIDLAFIVGSNQEAISLVMAHLERDGILAVTESEIVIMDLDCLKTIVTAPES